MTNYYYYFFFRTSQSPDMLRVSGIFKLLEILLRVDRYPKLTMVQKSESLTRAFFQLENLQKLNNCVTQLFHTETNSTRKTIVEGRKGRGQITCNEIFC